MNITNGFPRPVLTGVDDQSTRQVTYEAIADSQHLPLFLLRTLKGPTEVTVVNSSLFTGIYGVESTDPNTPYHNHQTEALKAAFRAGNATVAIKRVVGVETSTSQYNVFLDTIVGATGDSTYKVTTDTVTTDPLKVVSLINIPANNVGKWADEYGISICPASANTQMLNQTRYNGFIYELRVFKRDKLTNRKSVVYTNYRDDRILFTLNPDTKLSTDNPYYLPTVMADMFGNEENSKLGLFGDVTVNEDMFSNLHALLKSQGKTTAEYPWLYDILGTGGLLMAYDLVRNLSGGHDGYNDEDKGYVTNRVSNLEIFDSGARHYFESMVDGHDLSNTAKFPISTFYDTGFSMKTKLSFRNLLSIRPDVWIGLSAFMVADHYIDIDGTEAFEYESSVPQDEAINIATRLRTAFMLYPESEVHGTPTMRVILTIQSGINKLSGYNRRQSLIVDILEKISLYLGAGDGVWKGQYAFDQAPINELRGWINVNYTYRSKVLKETCWDFGIVWVESNGTHTLFYPAFQTIYPDDKSTLNNIFTMMGCCYLNKVVHRVWAQVTGNARDPDVLLADKISTLVEKEVLGKFDNRFKIEALTEFTPADKERGYSWTTSISIYSNVTPSVGVYKITTHRMS